MLSTLELDSFEKLHTNLLKTVFKGDKKMDPQDLSIALLYISMNDKARSIEILLNQNVLDSVKIIQRSMLEQYVYLLFILKSDTVRRGRAYFYGNKVVGIKYWNNLKRDYSDKGLIEKVSNDLEKHISNGPVGDNYDEYCKYYRDKYNSLFDKDVKDKRQWFNIYGDTKYISELFKKMNMLDEYRFIYAANSESTHGTNMPGDLKVDKGGFTVVQSIDDMNMDSFIIGYLFQGIQKIANYYEYSPSESNQEYFKNVNAVVQRYWKRKYHVNLEIEN